MFGKFCFNSVGQGLFYSGKIEADKKKFNFVYDCGSTSNRGFLDKEITLYDSEHCGEDIDMLVISHFDIDHFNGISELLRKHSVKTVMIPYLSIIERVKYGLLLLNENINDEEKIRLMEIYYNPVRYFISHAQNVVQVCHKDNDFNDLRGESLGVGPHNWSIFENDKCRKWIVKDSQFTINFKEWEFVFYNKPANTSKLREYEIELDEFLSSRGYSIFELHDMMKDYNAFITLAKNIKKKMPQKKMNTNSIVMYHGPKYHDSYNRFYCWRGYCQHNNIRDEFYKQNFCRCGTLLSGDYDTFNKDWCDIVSEIGKNRIVKIGHFQVPHHGAKSSFNKYGDFDNCIISYGTQNNYRHPDKDVLFEMAASKTQLWLVNEWNNYIYYVED